ASRPHVAFVGRIPGFRGLSDMARNPDNVPVPGALIFRVDAALLYFNVGHVHDVVWERIRSSAERVRLVACDLSTTPNIDLAGARVFCKAERGEAAAGGAGFPHPAPPPARGGRRGAGRERTR